MLFVARLHNNNINVNVSLEGVSFCHHLVSVICGLLTFHILIFSSKTTWPNEKIFTCGGHVC